MRAHYRVVVEASGRAVQQQSGARSLMMACPPSQGTRMPMKVVGA